LLAFVTLGLAALARFHNAFAYPPLYDFDGPGHALSVYALREGALPPVLSWAGFHPPLYHALGAGLWLLLPAAIPVHVQLRLLSAAAGLGAVIVAWWALACRAEGDAERADVASVTALALGVPVVAIASGMIGNETLCTLFTTALLAHLQRHSDGIAPAAPLRGALVSALLGAGAAASKATGLVVVGVASLTQLVRLRRTPRQACLAASLAGGLPLLVLLPLQARVLAAAAGSPLALVTGAALSAEMRAEMAEQPPGKRHLGDYFSLPLSTFTAPVLTSPGLQRSVPGLLHASAWADGHGQFLPFGVPAVLRAEAALSVAGLLPAGLALLGGVRLARQRGAGGAPALVFGALLILAFLRYAWVIPHYSAVKASYLLPALLAGLLLLTEGLGALPGRLRNIGRASCVALGWAGLALTWQGWWT
jgi:hypothetical protein